MILNKGHWDWSDSVNDDFLAVYGFIQSRHTCCRQLCSPHVAERRRRFSLSVIQIQPNEFITKMLLIVVNTESGCRGVRSWRCGRCRLFLQIWNLFLIQPRRECEKNVHWDIIYVTECIWPSPLHALHTLSFLYIVCRSICIFMFFYSMWFMGTHCICGTSAYLYVIIVSPFELL